MRAGLERWLFDPLIGKILSAGIGLLVLVVLVRFLRGLLTRFIKDSDTRYRARKLVSFLSYFVGLMLLALVFSDRLGRLTVALGVAGAGVAFALQEIIASVAGWVAISFANFFTVGDRVQLGGIKGDVIDIGVLRTTLMECGQWVKADQYNGRIVRVANSFVFKEPVFNYSADFPFLWDEISVPVKYGSDHRLARELFQRIAEEVVGDYVAFAKSNWEEMIGKYRIDAVDLDPKVSLVANDNWMEFSIRYIVDYKKRRPNKDKLFTRILDEIQRTNGKVALASATFHLVEAPVVHVQLTERKDNAKPE